MQQIQNASNAKMNPLYVAGMCLSHGEALLVAIKKKTLEARSVYLYWAAYLVYNK